MLVRCITFHSKRFMHGKSWGIIQNFCKELGSLWGRILFRSSSLPRLFFITELSHSKFSLVFMLVINRDQKFLQSYTEGKDICVSKSWKSRGKTLRTYIYIYNMSFSDVGKVCDDYCDPSAAMKYWTSRFEIASSLKKSLNILQLFTQFMTEGRSMLEEYLFTYRWILDSFCYFLKKVEWIPHRKYINPTYLPYSSRLSYFYFVEYTTHCLECRKTVWHSETCSTIW